MDLNGYIITAIGAILTAVFAWIGSKVRDAMDKYLTDHTKKSVAKTCVMAVEQLYHDLSGAEKLEKAETGIREMLEEKGITISELEMKMLIEAAVGGFNYGLNGKKEAVYELECDLPEEEPDEEAEYTEEGTSA